jgi:microcystin-dependent protein
MANVSETANFDPGVYRIEITDLVQGGETGISNKGIKNLANRTLFLKQQIDRFLLQGIRSVTATASTNMTDSDIGKLVVLTTNSTIDVDYDLFDANRVAAGTRFVLSAMNIWGVGDNIVNVRPVITTNLVDLSSGINYQLGLALRKFDWIELVSDGINTWYIVNKELNKDVGSVVPFAFASVPPFGYLLCNGAAVSRNIYARLFNAIGTTYGIGDGFSSFNIPDLRGEFIRGFDAGRGVDTSTLAVSCFTTNGVSIVIVNDGTTGLFVGMSVTGTGIPANTTVTAIIDRTLITLSNPATATNGGITLTFTSTRTMGSTQADMLKKHEHFYALASNNVHGGSPSATLIDWDGANLEQTYDVNMNTEYVGGFETRPRNVAMSYAIKF